MACRMQKIPEIARNIKFSLLISLKKKIIKRYFKRILKKNELIQLLELYSSNDYEYEELLNFLKFSIFGKKTFFQKILNFELAVYQILPKLSQNPENLRTFIINQIFRLDNKINNLIH
ncbi:hypothetical protein BpHYR1_045824 [Brachionus plicatilis]|uniref:Uncharacterized protein n=1 Tax=Brachionus plicatilis TaxID=10195 RepID=A0A3M7P7I2_BRAPC|nr:hypothetical protein BpHYR1_045824 [Brachionus plicatilis]